MAGLTEYHPQFFTATILEWKPLLSEDKYKDVLYEKGRSEWKFLSHYLG
ncbi:MAG: hypothetical protein ACR2KB_12530 [Chitinophagaceae bacterium]